MVYSEDVSEECGFCRRQSIQAPPPVVHRPAMTYSRDCRALTSPGLLHSIRYVIELQSYSKHQHQLEYVFSQKQQQHRVSGRGISTASSTSTKSGSLTSLTTNSTTSEARSKHVGSRSIHALYSEVAIIPYSETFNQAYGKLRWERFAGRIRVFLKTLHIRRPKIETGSRDLPPRVQAAMKRR